VKRPPTQARQAADQVRPIQSSFIGVTTRFRFDASTDLLSTPGKEVHLTRRESEILRFLLGKHPTPVSQQEIYKEFWGSESHDSRNPVPVHMNNLRVKLAGEITDARDTGSYRLTRVVPVDLPEGKWLEILDAADNVGRYVFEKFNANAILTFAGHSAFFANLVLVRSLPADKMLELPVYLALQRDWSLDMTSELPREFGYETFRGEDVVVLVPHALTQLPEDRRASLRLAVIDDVVISGDVVFTLKRDLKPRLPNLAFTSYLGFTEVAGAIRVRTPDYVVRWLKTMDEVRAFQTCYETGLKWFGCSAITVTVPTAHRPGEPAAPASTNTP
jgi:hypothetical protein